MKISYISQNCEYLFAIFHHLQKGETNKFGVHVGHCLTYGKWKVKIFKARSIYSKPKTQKLKKASRPQSTQNPDREIGQLCELSNLEDNAFNSIGIKTHLR